MCQEFGDSRLIRGSSLRNRKSQELGLLNYSVLAYWDHPELPNFAQAKLFSVDQMWVMCLRIPASNCSSLGLRVLLREAEKSGAREGVVSNQPEQ